jgi:hypothetical protein
MNIMRKKWWRENPKHFHNLLCQNQDAFQKPVSDSSKAPKKGHKNQTTNKKVTTNQVNKVVPQNATSQEEKPITDYFLFNLIRHTFMRILEQRNCENKWCYLQNT